MALISSVQAIAAAPAPFTTTRMSASLRPVISQALISPAAVMMAVPCWSSWNTGMFIRSRSVCSMMKHSGAAMSSRLMPPKLGSSSSTASMKRCASSVFTSMSIASTSAKRLNSTALPSITGLDASAPRLPRPRIAVPFHSAESYLARLIKAGHRVAIAEQTESPAEARKARGSKALVDRAIIRLVTPGTLTEETLLESASANWLAAIGRAGDEWAIAAADISTGRFELIACGPGELAAELARLSAAEVIADAPVPGVRTSAGKGGFDSLAGERALKTRFGLATLEGLGGPSRAELAAAGGLLAYLDATQKGSGILLQAPRRVSRSAHMA